MNTTQLRPGNLVYANGGIKTVTGDHGEVIKAYSKDKGFDFFKPEELEPIPFTQETAAELFGFEYKESVQTNGDGYPYLHLAYGEYEFLFWLQAKSLSVHNLDKVYFFDVSHEVHRIQNFVWSVLGEDLKRI